MSLSTATRLAVYEVVSTGIGAVVFAGILVVAAAHALCDPALAQSEPGKTIVFAPDRADRCDYFLVTEFNVSATGVKSQDAVDQFLFTDALGLMRNIDRSRAVGASIDAHLSGGALRFTPTIRFKQWLSGRKSLDLSLGYAFASIEQEGVIGLIGNVRYGLTPWFHVQAGACRLRNVTSIWYGPDSQVSRVEGSTQTTFHAGIGLGGVPGVISWGAQAIGYGTLVVLFSGID